jgi:hypothetical protein
VLKEKRSCMERRSGAPRFLYAVMHTLKVIEVVWIIDRKPLVFIRGVVHIKNIRDDKECQSGAHN